MAIFMEKLQKVREHEKRVNSSLQVRLGDEPPTEAERERVAALRAEHAARIQQQELDAVASRTRTVKHVAGAIVTASNGEGPPLLAHGPAEEDGKGKTGPPEDVLIALQNGDMFDDLAKRVFSSKRFINAARLVIIR